MHANFDVNHFLNHLPIKWFDVAAVVVVLLGFRQGRKHGMSVEMLISLQWIAMVFTAGFFYRDVGDWLASTAPVSHLFCYIIAYITLAIGVKLIFSMIRRGLGGKLLGSNIFGITEFYLGMLMGAIRFACVLMFGLALLNARSYTQQEIDAKIKFQNDVYGSTFFPELPTVQQAVFKDSYSGKWIKKYASFMLIAPTAPEKRELNRRKEDY